MYLSTIRYSIIQMITTFRNDVISLKLKNEKWKMDLAISIY